MPVGHENEWWLTSTGIPETLYTRPLAFIEMGAIVDNKLRAIGLLRESETSVVRKQQWQGVHLEMRWVYMHFRIVSLPVTILAKKKLPLQCD